MAIRKKTGHQSRAKKVSAEYLAGRKTLNAEPRTVAGAASKANRIRVERYAERKARIKLWASGKTDRMIRDEAEAEARDEAAALAALPKSQRPKRPYNRNINNNMLERGELPAGFDEEPEEPQYNFIPGNKFWEKRSSHGRKPVFDNPEDLWNAACEYFTWADESPLWEMKAFMYKGDVAQEAIPKMRAMTMGGLYLYLDIGKTTFFRYDANEEFNEVTTRIKDTIWGQKFAGAAADLLNPQIIARDLGLTDKKEENSDGERVEQLGTTEAVARLVGILNAARKRGNEQDNPDPDRRLGAPDRPPGKGVPLLR